MMSLGLDPCGNYATKESILAIYIELLISGENITNREELRSLTIAGYISEINKLHEKRNIQKPISLKGPSKPAILYRNLRAEEDIARRRQPLLPTTAAKIIAAGSAAPSNSKTALISDLLILARLVGPRAAEIVQRTNSKADYHTYPSGKTVVKSLCHDNFTFFDRRGRLIEPGSPTEDKIHSMKITWTIQKNRRNGEWLTYTREYGNPKLCTVLAALRLIRRSTSLNQPSNLPLAVYSGQGNAMRYLTATQLTQHLRTYSKRANPTLSKQDLSLISCHSLRVWACVLLSEAGENGDKIRIRLRWLSEAHRVYLRDTQASGSSHNKALKKASSELTFEITRSNLASVVPHTAPLDDEMGDFLDHP